MLHTSPNKILLIKPSAIGDVVHTLPFLALLRRKFPHAYIAWLVTPACSGLLDRHPLLSEVILFDRKRYGTAIKSPAAAKEFRHFTQSLKDRDFDLVIDLQGLFRSGYLAWKTGAKTRVGFGYAREAAPLFYTHRIPRHPHERHAIERYLDIAEALGLGRGPLEYAWNTTETHRAKAAELLAPLQPTSNSFAALIPGTNWETKRWPAQRFKLLAQRLRTELDLPSVVIGAASDKPLADIIQPDLDLTGKSTLPETTALLERATIVIANDTGPMHIAAALGRPLVTLYGPTSPLRTGPHNRLDTVLRLDLPCSPCLSRTCSHTSCMNWLTEQAVLDQVKIQLQRT